MADVIEALHKKRAALVGQKRCIELESKARIEEIDAQVAEVDRALLVLNAAVKEFLCKRCNGTGVIRRPDAAGQMEDCECPDCRGTGVPIK